LIREIAHVGGSVFPQLAARVLFTIEAKEAILLHGFIKKSQKTPSDDLLTAIGRLKQLHAARHR